MTWDQMEGKWKQLTGRVREKWGELTDDDVDVIAGKRDRLLGKLQERYAIKKAEAEKQVDSFIRQL
jgi:uncharacterized protein YjbJ (UPF0337 family)